MEIKKILLSLSCIICAVLCSGNQPSVELSIYDSNENTGKNLRVLLITQRPCSHDELFCQMIFSLSDFRIDALAQPIANQSLISDSIELYDVIAFYDRGQDISLEEKEAFLSLTERGTGLVFLHHSITSYQEWDLFKNILGGKYYQGKYDYPPEKISGYKHDIVMTVKVLDSTHPVTKGLDDFEIVDEGYSNIEVLPDVTPILITDHPDCSEIIGWTNQYNNSKVVYILLGHDNNAWSNENFQKIVSNALKWTGKN